MQEEATQLDTCANKNNMIMNGDKSYELRLCFSKNPPVPPPLTLGGKEVPVVECATYLGFKRHRSLGWDSQILHMAKKGSTRLHFLRMLKKGGMPPEDLETVYTTLIRPVLEYANVVYVGCNTKQNNTLEAVQRRAARIIYGNSTQTTPFFTLQDRRETAAKTLLKQMRHVSHTLHSLMPCDRHQSTLRSLRNGNHISVPNRLEPKNRKDRGHSVANLAARPSATSDNVNKHLHKRPHLTGTKPRQAAKNSDIFATVSTSGGDIFGRHDGLLDLTGSGRQSALSYTSTTDAHELQNDSSSNLPSPTSLELPHLSSVPVLTGPTSGATVKTERGEHVTTDVAARAPRSVSSIVDQRIAETLCDDCHFSLSCFHPGAVMSDVSAPASRECGQIKPQAPSQSESAPRHDVIFARLRPKPSFHWLLMNLCILWAVLLSEDQFKGDLTRNKTVFS
ncbi:hypothetical protein Bbelb_342490 [Branchiostoma belcheri]|nr:hypothetical protein Bbelb_342490 [Branchiostoma belcheri]